MNSLFMTDDKKASYVRAFLHIDAKNLSFVEASKGVYKTTFDMIVSSFGDNGVPVDGERSTFTLNLTEDGFNKVKEHGLVYNFNFPVKKPGAYQMRVAIRDVASNLVGSANQFVEVPNLKKGRLALSGILLEATPYDIWKGLNSMTPEQAREVYNPVTDTAIRQFSPGSVLTYATNVYNAKTDATGKTNLTIQARLFNDQKLIFEAPPTPVANGQEALDSSAKAGLLLGAKLPAGNYTLQVIVTDKNAKDGHQIAYQFVPFEIVR
jgi:hypothetical protein